MIKIFPAVIKLKNVITPITVFSEQEVLDLALNYLGEDYAHLLNECIEGYVAQIEYLEDDVGV